MASLLGNFTINQFSGLTIGDAALDVHYSVVFGQLPALRELHAADSDGDGVTTQAERDAYARHLAPMIADALVLTVDGQRVALRMKRLTTSLPTEQGGFSLRLDVDFVATMPPSDGEASHALGFANRNYAGRIGWNEIVVTTPSPWKAYATNAFDTSLTAGLTEALKELPAAGPLQERAIHLVMTRGALPATAIALGGRAVSASPAVAKTLNTPAMAPPDNFIQAQTRHLIDLISARELPLSLTLWALLAAALLGALHAFSPGHGKTVVGAYLIGSRATARHALFLGATVTITHTLGVFALGFATLFAARYVVSETLLPLLSLGSGLLVLGMGAWLLLQRWPSRGGHPQTSGQRAAGAAQSRLQWHAWAPAMTGHSHTAHVLAYVEGGTRVIGRHAHGAHVHGTHSPGMHSHGGRAHTHLPLSAAGEHISWRGLAALGVSGGLVPCPSALVILLAAVALNKTAYGLLLVIAFSTGLAVTLTLVGLAFLYARNRLPSLTAGSRALRWLPVASAAAIVVVGALLCYSAVSVFPR